MYYVVDTQNRATGSHALVLAGTSMGMLMTTVQLLAVLGTLPLEYVDQGDPNDVFRGVPFTRGKDRGPI